MVVLAGWFVITGAITSVEVPGANATPRNAVRIAAVAITVGVEVNAALYPPASSRLTRSPPPFAELPPLRVANRVTVVLETLPVNPRYASLARPAVPLDVH